MANRKAGSAGDGSTGEAKRPGAGRKSAGAATGGADQGAQTGGSTGARKQATGSRGSEATTRSGSTTAEGQAMKSTGGRSAAKGAAKTGTAGSGQGGGDSAARGAAKGGTKAATRGAAKGATKGASRGGGAGGLDLRGDLRQFVNDNPHGWDHQGWQGLLDRLGQRGHDTSNPEQIGMQLERERLSAQLEGTEGVSSQKAKSIIERFGTLYSLRNADADEIAREAKVSREVAERIKSRLG